MEEIFVILKSKGYIITEEGKVLNTKSNREIKGTLNTSGYIGFTHKINDKQVKIYFHKLQAFQKYGNLIFKNNNVVRHLDGNKQNNTYLNISIGTQSDNMLDKPKELRVRQGIQASRSFQETRRTLKERQEIYKKLKNGLTYKEIMSQHKISKSTLSYMKNHSLEYKENNLTN